MVAAILAGLAFALTDNTSNEIVSRGLWLVGGLLCQVRLLCNLFDGMVAIAQAKASAKGELYNEVPDRVSDAAISNRTGLGVWRYAIRWRSSSNGGGLRGLCASDGKNRRRG